MLLHVVDDVGVELESFIVFDGLDHLPVGPLEVIELASPDVLAVVLGDLPDVGHVLGELIVEDLDLVRAPPLDVDIRLFAAAPIDVVPGTVVAALRVGTFGVEVEVVPREAEFRRARKPS